MVFTSKTVLICSIIEHAVLVC